MIPDILEQKEVILSKIQKAGIDIDNLHSVHLFGSHFWGYANENSDIDLYIVLKSPKDKVPDIDNLSLHYQITTEEINQKISNGSWASFYVLNYCSELLYGEKVKTIEYPKVKIKDYLKEKSEDYNLIDEKGLPFAFIVIMLRIFFLNYVIGINSFKLDDFKKSNVLSVEQKTFLERKYNDLYMGRRIDNEDRQVFQKLFKNLDNKIETWEKGYPSSY